MVTEYKGSIKEKQKLFSQAGIKAIYDAKQLQIPITFVRDCSIIKQYADGREEVLGIVPPRVSITIKKIKI